MPSYFITGASRGLGLAFATKLLQTPGNTVIASARSTSAPQLTDLSSRAGKDLPGTLHLVPLDVADFDAYPAAVAATEKLLPDGEGLDYLLLNAGVDLQTNEAFVTGKTDWKVFEEELRINTIAPIATLRAFQPLLEKGTAKKALLLSTEMGSLTLASNIPFLSDTYSVTKAAANMAIRKYGAALKTLGSPLTLLIVYPGLVYETPLGLALKSYFDKYAPDYPVTKLDDAVQGTLKVMHDAMAEDHCKFLNHKHEERPW